MKEQLVLYSSSGITAKQPLGIGISMLATVFSVLCIVTFSVLTIVSANADRTLTRKSVDAISAYIAAENNAERTLAEIDNILLNAYNGSAQESDYLARAALEIKKAKHLAINGRILSFTQPISDTQHIKVVIEIRYPQKGEKLYNIVEWTSRSTTEWTPKDNINLPTKGQLN